MQKIRKSQVILVECFPKLSKLYYIKDIVHFLIHFIQFLGYCCILFIRNKVRGLWYVLSWAVIWKTDLTMSVVPQSGWKEGVTRPHHGDCFCSVSHSFQLFLLTYKSSNQSRITSFLHRICTTTMRNHRYLTNINHLQNILFEN